jgi:hypothetical protein
MSDGTQIPPQKTGSFLKLGLIFAAAAGLGGCTAAAVIGTTEAELSEAWVGNVSYAIDRASCGGVCDGALRPIPGEVLYDTWARQRASIRVIAFEIWKEGVTDWENPDRWRQLYVQVHARAVGEGRFSTRHVPGDRRLGNNVRYTVDLVALDPIPGVHTPTRVEDCPAATLTAAASHVDAIVELYFTVNGIERRPAGPDSTYRVRYQNYRDLYAPCF